MKLSIIIPVKNQKLITQLCLDSLEKYTKDYELIVIDDGSDEETKEYLDTYMGFYDTASQFRKRPVIRNDKSVGWCKAINQGIERATGDYVVFSNNDVVFTPQWSELMIAHFERDSQLGVLGPTTNKVDGYQHVDYNKKGIDYQYTDVLTFFCVMVKRKTLDEVGKLDERFGLGGQDDADYCIRAREKGYKIGIARDVFIYHYGSATFREEFNNDINYSHEYSQDRINILRDKYKDKVDTGIRKRIFIAIPNRGTIVTGLRRVLSLWEKDPRYIIQIYDPEGLFPLDNARNKCVKEFLETDCDYLFWIDDDIIPPLNALDRLIHTDKDIIGAVAFAMKEEKGKYFPYPVTLRFNKDKKYIVYYGKGIEEVDATGGACLLCKRKVYEDIPRPYEFVYYPDGTLNLTCDFLVHQKFQEKGYKIFIDFNLICDHIRTCRIKGFQDLLASLNQKSE